MIDQDALDRITDKVFEPGLKVIAGSDDSPVVINGIEIAAYVLEDKTRVFSQGSFLQAIGRSRTPSTDSGSDVENLPPFLSAKNLRPFISQHIVTSSTPIKFQSPSRGPVTYGYRAELLPEVCGVYLDARRGGALLPSQMKIAERAEILLMGLAEVGIIALVDAATGYEKFRSQQALADILERYIAERFRPWTRTFPYEFYEEIFRLNGWDDPGSGNRPSVIGHYTNDIVYARIAPGILEELQRINPTLPSGHRRQRHHQWFTPDLGHPDLIRHLDRIIGMMMASTSWADFKRHLDSKMPKVNTNLPLPLEIDGE